jgi:hypothetical protein
MCYQSQQRAMCRFDPGLRLESIEQGRRKVLPDGNKMIQYAFCGITKNINDVCRFRAYPGGSHPDFRQTKCQSFDVKSIIVTRGETKGLHVLSTICSFFERYTIIPKSSCLKKTQKQKSEERSVTNTAVH